MLIFIKAINILRYSNSLERTQPKLFPQPCAYTQIFITDTGFHVLKCFCCTYSGTKVHSRTFVLMDPCKVELKYSVKLSRSQLATCTRAHTDTFTLLQCLKKSSHFRSCWSFPTEFFLQILLLARYYLQSVFPSETCQIFGAMQNKGLTTFVTLNSI